MAAKRNAREQFSLCLGSLPASCHVFPGGWTKTELQSLQGSSLSPLTGLLKAWHVFPCISLNTVAKYNNLFCLCEHHFHSYLIFNFFFHKQLVAFGSR